MTLQPPGKNTIYLIRVCCGCELMRFGGKWTFTHIRMWVVYHFYIVVIGTIINDSGHVASLKLQHGGGVSIKYATVPYVGCSFTSNSAVRSLWRCIYRQEHDLSDVYVFWFPNHALAGEIKIHIYQTVSRISFIKVLNGTIMTDSRHIISSAVWWRCIHLFL